MSTIQRLARFLPSPPPQNIPISVQEWLREEFERIAFAANGALELADDLRGAPRMFLGGDADDFNLDTIDSPIVNYTQDAAIGEFAVDPDPVLGTITIPRDGLWRVSCYMYGLQPSVTQNETIRLLVEVDGIASIVASLDVTSAQTQDRTLSASITRVLSEGNVLRMMMDATADMGTFLIQQTTFEVTIVTGANEEGEAQARDQNLIWFP